MSGHEHCSVCGCNTDRILIDVDNITFRDEGFLPVQYCKDCFGKLPGKGSDEFERMHRRVQDRWVEQRRHRADCHGRETCLNCKWDGALDHGHIFSDDAKGRMVCTMEIIEVYTVEGVVFQVQVG